MNTGPEAKQAAKSEVHSMLMELYTEIQTTIDRDDDPMEQLTRARKKLLACADKLNQHCGPVVGNSGKMKDRDAASPNTK